MLPWVNEDTDNRVEEDEASATEIDDAEDTTLLYQIPKKSRKE